MRSPRLSKIASVLAAGSLLFITACNSSSSDTTASTTTTTVALDPVPTSGACSEAEPCAVGDTGPGGGTIIYTSDAAFKCGADMKNGCNAIEVAPSEWEKSITLGGNCSAHTKSDPSCLYFAREKNILDTSKQTGMGGGYFNSSSAHGTGSSVAAYHASLYKGGDSATWYLPDMDELNVVCLWARGLSTADPKAKCEGGTLKSGMDNTYWSSTAETKYYMKALDFGSGSWTFGSNWDDTMWVRPIRALSASLRDPSATTTTVKATTTTEAATATTVKATTTTTAAKTCATGGSCAVGDTGPGGGKVYYSSAQGFPCGATLASTCHYLEVSDSSWHSSVTSPCTTPNALSTFCAWGAASTVYVANDSHAGRGLKNSLAIAAAYNNTGGYAAMQAMAYRGGGKSDWYLPNNDELRMLCTWANGGTAVDNSSNCTPGTLKADFAGQDYWSSTDGGSGMVNTYSFTTGAHLAAVKDQLREVRPIRAF